MECNGCKDYEVFIKEIIGAQMLAWNHGGKYTGDAFRYCPWCGEKLILTEDDKQAQTYNTRPKGDS